MRLRHHNHLDYSCEIDSEDIPYGASHFTNDLARDMYLHSHSWLTSHYPELIFWLHFGARPTNSDFCEQLKKGIWRCAAWRQN